MDNLEKIIFLRAKAKAIVDSGVLTPDDAARMMPNHERLFDLIKKKVFPSSAFRDIDSELEVRLRCAFRKKSDADEIRRRLRAGFGMSSLSATPEIVAKKILKHGRIRTADEADQMRDFLTEVDSCHNLLGETGALKLEGLLAEWEKEEQRNK